MAMHHPQKFLDADTICEFILTNLEIDFQARGESMDQREVAAHFMKRESLLMVRVLLISEGVRAMNTLTK